MSKPPPPSPAHSLTDPPTFTVQIDTDHASINALAGSVRRARTASARLAALTTVTWRLIRHDVSEHLVMRPAFAAHLGDQGRQMGEHDREDHERARAVLLGLLADVGGLGDKDGTRDGVETDDDRRKSAHFMRRVDALFGELGEHMRVESGEHIPMLEAVLGAEESAELARKYARTQVLTPELVVGGRRVWEGGVAEYVRTGLGRFEEVWERVEGEWERGREREGQEKL